MTEDVKSKNDKSLSELVEETNLQTNELLNPIRNSSVSGVTPYGTEWSPLRIIEHNPGVSQGSISFSEARKREREEATVESEEETSEEENKEEEDTEQGVVMEDPDESFKPLCRDCVIRDLEGCGQCGIYIYGYRHKQFKIIAEKL